MCLATAIVCNQLQNEVLYSVDGIVYAQVAKELTLQPLTRWVRLAIDGVPFFEHPPATPWMLAIAMRLLGASTFAAVLPMALLALATVYLSYLIGRTLIDHELGLLTATVLTLTPEFVRGRNPMLEPALMFFVMLTVYFHLASARVEHFTRCTVSAGLAFGFALLAKGPPAMLALAAIAVFQAVARLRPDAFAPLTLSARRLTIQLAAVVLIAAAIVLLVDIWYRSVAGVSFFEHYIEHQLRYTIVEGRGAASNQWGYYARTFVRYWPWWPLVLASGAVVAWKRDARALPALALGGIVTAGTYAGFTLMTHKAEWYTNIHYVGSSVLAALPLRYALPKERLARYYQPFVLVVVAPLLFLSAIVPSVFLQYNRPFERFMESARAALGDRLSGEPLADCVGLEPWRGPFFVRFYLGMRTVECGDPGARFRLVDHRRQALEAGDRLVFSQQPFSVVERPRAH